MVQVFMMTQQLKVPFSTVMRSLYGTLLLFLLLNITLDALFYIDFILILL